MIRHLKPGATVPAALLLLLLIWSPLPFGSVLPFDRAALQVGALAAFAFAVVGARDGALKPVRNSLLLLLLIGLLGLVQALPWPRALTGVVSSRSVELADRAEVVLDASSPFEASATTPRAASPDPRPTGSPRSWVAPSLVPSVTRAVAVHWLAMAAAFGAAALVGRKQSLRRLLGIGLLAVAVFEVVYGSDRWFKEMSTIWGVEVPGGVDRLRGTFVNPDHLAFFFVICLGVCGAWLWWAVRRLRHGGQLERTLLELTAPLMAFVMIFAGLAFTGSRAGLLAAVMMLLVQAALLARHYRSLRVLALGAGSVVLGFGAIAVFGLQAGLGRWFETSAYDLAWNSRFEIYRTSLGLWREFPLLGTGLGTFREALPLVQESDLQGTWLHAHSDIVELLVTGGILAIPIAGVFCFVLARRLFRVFERGSRSEDRAAGLAGLGALAGGLLMSAVDFGLTMPANAFAMAVVCGLCAGVPAGRGELRGASGPRARREPAGRALESRRRRSESTTLGDAAPP